jgi:hypothetical protein
MVMVLVMVAVVDRELFMWRIWERERSIFDLSMSDLGLWLMSSRTVIWHCIM